MLQVVSIKYVKQHKFYVELSDGQRGCFDLKPYLNKGVFTELNDIDYLKTVKIDSFGIFWPNGQDLTADTIKYELQSDIDD